MTDPQSNLHGATTPQPPMQYSANAQAGPQGQPDPYAYPYPQVPLAPPTGRGSWALGFLAYIPVPFLSMLIAGIAMACSYPSVKKKGIPVATQNARFAANWGLTILTYLVVAVIYMVSLGLAGVREGFFPFGWAIVGYVVLCVVHLIVTITGVVIAGKGQVFQNRLAIPYIRRPKD